MTSRCRRRSSRLRSMSGIGHKSGACGDARASGPVSFRERDKGRQEEVLVPHLVEGRTKSSMMHPTCTRLTWDHLLSRPVGPPASARARRYPFPRRFAWVALFSRKDWRFQMAFSDKGGENRFIFFSGVVHQTTPFFFAGLSSQARHLWIFVAAVGIFRYYRSIDSEPCAGSSGMTVLLTLPGRPSRVLAGQKVAAVGVSRLKNVERNH